MNKLFIKRLVINLLIITSTACTMEMGSYGINSHFSYPNSNVTPLKQVKATASRLSIIIPPSLHGTEIIKLTQDAIAQQSGADLLLNYSLDTKMTSFIFVHKMDTTITGTAAKMKIGTQELKDFYGTIKYKAK